MHEQNSLLLLFIYSGFTINLILQCGLGIKGVVESKNPFGISILIKSLVIFFTVVLLWLFFSKIVYSILPGLFIYVILFPVSSLVYEGVEYLIFKYLFRKKTDNPQEEKSLYNFHGGITAVSVFLCINLANNFLETVVLSLGFTSGLFFVNLIIREIRRRAAFEAVPVFLRGKPLILVTMGMLSLVFTTASFLLFRMIGAR